MASNHHHQDTTAFATNASSNDDAARGTKRKHDDDEENRAYQAVLRCLMDLYEDDPPREDDNNRAAMYTSDGIAPAIIYDSELRCHQAAAPDDDEESVDQDQARQAVLRCLMDLYEDDPPAEDPLPREADDDARVAIAPAIIYDSETRYRRAAAAAIDLPRLAVPCHKKRKTNRGLQKPGRRRTMHRLPICRNTTAAEAPPNPSFVRDCQQEDNIGVIDLTATDDEQEQGDGNQDKTNAINDSNAAALYDNEDDEETDEESEMQEEEDHDEDEDVDTCNEEVEAFEEHPDPVHPRQQEYDRLWEENFQLLVTYKEIHKTTKVPTRYPVLGVWVSKQRMKYRKEEMSNYRKQRLNSIGFEWDGKQDKHFDEQWEDKFQLLVTYKEIHKTTKVPTRYPVLGVWVQTQRKKYGKEEMSDYHKQKLNSIGFEWKLKKKTPWVDMYTSLVAYYYHRDTTIVSKKDDPKLYKWVWDQRRHCKDPHKISLLNDIGFQWSLKRKDTILL